MNFTGGVKRRVMGPKSVTLFCQHERYTIYILAADDLRPGKPELRMRIRQESYGMGIDGAEAGRQLQAAFQGLKADEIQVGPESYEIEVRLAGMDRDSLQDIENFNFVLPNAQQVPLKAVVEWKLEKGWARIARFNGMRT